MGHWVKTPPAETDNLGSIPMTYMMEEENGPLQAALCPPQAMVYTHRHIRSCLPSPLPFPHIHKIN